MSTPVPIARYAMNDPDLGADSSGSGLNMSNGGVSFVSDSERGPVASFDGSSQLTLASHQVPSAILGTAPRTFVYWMKMDRSTNTSGQMIIHYQAQGGTGTFFYNKIDGNSKQSIDIGGSSAIGSTAIPADIWTHAAVTHESGVTKFYIEGVLTLTMNATVNTGGNPLKIGGPGGVGFSGQLSDFRIYAEALSAEQLVADFLGSGSATSLFTTRPGPINIKTDIDAVPDAVALKLTYQAPTGRETTAFSDFLSGSKNVKPLEPEVEYTIRLYVNSGAGYELVEEQAVSTLANSAANYQVNDFVQDGRIKLDGLDADAKTRMSAVMNELFTTGDKIDVSIGAKKSTEATFVNRGGISRVEDAEALLLPFDTGSGAAQTINLQLSDDSTKAVTYDEAANTIAVDSVVYNPGDIFVIDEKKCTVLAY